ncbi:uncharacterized protein LOC110720755 [Chenopodium quinoa]|uniref:uncharacterized protein LOC110720755 n=1 Tax=Chenopodium quinoa TaxID=63459 RepID=UPI000B799D51|nr:uncharacterized protein LOC110720755 [Chenopodium quinoa]
MSKEKWVEEFCSFMREVVTMRDELKGLKERLHSIDLSNPSTLLNDNKPKDIITLLTLWYWLAAWSSLDQPKDCCAKDEFIQAMEVQSKALGFLMVKITPIDPIEQQELQILLSKLLQMLKLDYQLWMDSLNHWIGTLTLQPSKAAEAYEPIVTSPTHWKSFNSTYNNTPYISFVSKVGKEVVEGIVTTVIQEGGKLIYEKREEILEKLKEMGNDVADIADKEFNNFVKEINGLVDVTKKGMEELGAGIEEAVKKSVEELECFGGKVWDELQKVGDALKDATDKVGDALKEGAKEVEDFADRVWKGLGSFLGF